jgi:ABC-2 type transport system ATP-binding protein
MNFAIEIENLTKDYQTGFWKKRNVRALDDLTLRVPSGQIFGFLGGNGAGKTTTIKILMSLLFPTSGSAKILDRNISDVDMHRDIGYCPENPYFYDYLTARELMNYFGEIFGLDRDQRRKRTEELLSIVGLDAKSWDRQLRKFSKGMLQRVGLAQSLINEPKIVFLDEPMSGLDPVGRREIRELIAALPAKGTTVFMSTHILSDAEALCDEVAILSRGKLAASGKLHELLNETHDAASYEVVLSGVTIEHLRQSLNGSTNLISRSDNTIAIAKKETDIDNILRAARGSGGFLLSVNPIRKSLEDLFISKTDSGNSDD